MRVTLKATILHVYGTQRRFSSATGIRENRLSSLIRGWASPTADEQQAITLALGRSGRGLFRNFEENSPLSAPNDDAA